jgi:hypothetical protein
VGLLIYFASLGPLPVARAYRIGTPAMVAVFEYSFLIFASLWAFCSGVRQRMRLLEPGSP